jgi:heme-degrading monooxygenase HmoA
MIVLQIYLTVEAAQAEKFEQMFATNYQPALRKQLGYQESRLLRIFDEATANEIAASSTPFNYQMELKFSSEEARRDWVRSPEHDEVWLLATTIATTAEWRGYEIIDFDTI